MKGNIVLILKPQSARGSAMKRKITESPFVFEFEYDSNDEGHLCYEHLICQLEDCADMLKVLYPQYSCSYLITHVGMINRQKVH